MTTMTSKTRVKKLARRVAAANDEKPAIVILREDEEVPPGTPDNAHVIRICYQD